MNSIEKAMQTKYPERVALVVCRDENGKVDVTPICYFINVSWKPYPKTWLISLWKGHFSTNVISKTKEFTLCFPTANQAKDVQYCGSVSGHNVNKLDNCGFKTLSPKKIKSPLLKDCTACFECKVIDKKLIYNQMAFVGKVVSASVCGKGKALYHFGNYKLGTFK